MFAMIRSFFAPFLSLILMMMASGLFNTFVSVRLDLEGYDPEVIGIVTSALYFGILAGSFKIDSWIAKVGHIRAFVVFALTLSILVIGQAFWINPWYWSGLRFLGGICMAGVFIVIESWLLMQSTPNMRGGILSVYLAVFYAALSAGQFLINLSDPMSIFPFCITAVLVAASALPITVKKVAAPKIEKPVRLNLLQLFRISPLGFMGGVISGMLLAVIYGLVPIYAAEIGMSVSQIGTFMAIIIFGGFSLQWPLGRWADKGDRRRVLNIASFTAAFFGLAIALVDHISLPLLFIFGWFFGGFSFTLYPLSMAYACERVREEQIVAATGGFVLSYGIGAILGPLLAPMAMDLLGSAGLFYFLSAITLLLGLIGLKRPCEPVDV
jgi:MFS family permease